MDARGPQGGLERAACPRSEAPLLSPVVMVQEAAHDDSTVAFRQRQEEVEEAAMGEEEDVEGGRPAGGALLCGLRVLREAGGCQAAPVLWTTSSGELVVLDSCFDLVEAGVFGRGWTPSTRMDLPSTPMRCALRRRSWLAGSTTSVRLWGVGLGTQGGGAYTSAFNKEGTFGGQVHDVQDVCEKPCSYTDFRLLLATKPAGKQPEKELPMAVEGDGRDVGAIHLKAVPASFDQYITMIKEGKNKDGGDRGTFGLKNVCSFDEYISSSKMDIFTETLTYHVTTSGSPLWNPSPVFCLELLVPNDATALKLPAATKPPPGGDSGIDFGRCPSPREDEYEEVETIPWETYLREKEEMEEKENEKESGLEEEKVDLWRTYFQKKKEKVEKEKMMEDRGDEVVLKKVPELKMTGKEKEKGKMVKVGNCWVPEATWLRSEEIARYLKARLFPNKRKRWEFELRTKVITAEKKEREVVQIDEFSLPGSEILFVGNVLAQVGEAPIPPEPENINFCTECMGDFVLR